MLSAGAPFFMVRQGQSLFVAEPLLSASLVSEGYTFGDVNIGAPATSDRTVFVCITTKDLAAWVRRANGAVTLGGLAMSYRNSYVAGFPASGQTCGSFVFSDVMGPSYGSAADLEITTLENGSEIDSLGVTVLATQQEGNSSVDSGGSGADFSQSATINDIATADDGYVIAPVAMEFSGNLLSSVTGNGSTGSLIKVVDQSVAGNHRHAVAIKAGLSAGATEDFTCTVSLGTGGFLYTMTSRE